MSNGPSHCVYCVRTHSFIDIAHSIAAGETALKRFSPEYGPNLVVLPMDVAAACHDAAYRTAPEEISLAVFDEMLGVLPPVGWKNDGAAESSR